MTDSASRPRIRPWTVDDLRGRYNLFVAAVGYEKRSRFVASEFRPNSEGSVALGFVDQQVLSYSENTSWYESAGFSVFHLSDAEFGDYWDMSLQKLVQRRKRDSVIRVCVDISSLTRSRIALILDGIRKYVESRYFVVDFVYSLAAFCEPPDSHPVNRHVGPILPSFAGWWSEPERTTVAVVGLGYEEDKALGAVELLQPGEVWILTPTSVIAEYSPALERANRTLLEAVPSSRRLYYRVEHPLDSYFALENLVNRLLTELNVIILPFGPKIFALLSLLVGLVHPDACVWRVSAGKTEVPQDRVANGEVYGLRLEL